MRKIESSKNPLFRQWADLLQSRGIKKYGQILVSGRKLVPEFLNDPDAKAIALLTMPGLERLENPRGVHEFELEKKLFKELDAFGTGYPLIVITAPKLRSADLSEPPKGIEILCAMGDPLNVGSLMRAACAFGAWRVILLKESASPFHPKALRASSGAALKLKLFSGPSIADIQSNPEFQKNLVVLDKNGAPISEFEWPKDFRLLIGEEGPGVPEELRKTRSVSIPISGEVESLNAVSAASIALFTWARARGKPLA